MTAPWVCPWCPLPHGPRTGTKPGAWEQQTLSGEWKRMCSRCSRRRLNNPWNALLGMRKVGDR
ncbi:hypothetical protein [Actinophytocola sediminis]